jgi:DNA gyrase subunit A
MKQDGDRGMLVGGFIVVDGDEVLAVKQSGQVTRSRIDETLRPTSRDTKGVKFVGVREGDAVAVVARSVESVLEETLDAAEDAAGVVAEDGTDNAAVDPSADAAEAPVGDDDVAGDATIEGGAGDDGPTSGPQTEES